MAENTIRYRFTVMTPTYNRAGTLPRVRDSLARQTFHDFEWLVVDDGSTDETAEVVGSWRASSEFPIRLVVQENGGKHTAVNRGVREAQGELFLVLDSDDACVPEALERFDHHWRSIPSDVRPGFTGVTALCRDQHGRPVGDRFPKDVIDSDSLEMRFRYRVRGEKWGFHRTDVLRAHPYPEPARGGYVGEDLVWMVIARKYRTRFINDVLRIYHIDEPSGSDQLTSRAGARRHAAGLAEWHATTLTDHISWFRYAPETFLRAAVHFSRFSFNAGAGVREQAALLRSPLALGLWLAGLPLGYLVHRRDLRGEPERGAEGI